MCQTYALTALLCTEEKETVLFRLVPVFYVVFCFLASFLCLILCSIHRFDVEHKFIYTLCDIITLHYAFDPFFVEHNISMYTHLDGVK